jgi:hypothetical protein
VFLPKAGSEDRSLSTAPVDSEDQKDLASGFSPQTLRAATSGVITAGTCKYRQRSDNPHVTFTTGSRNASVHGWWTKESTSGACPSKANVDITLQAFGCGSFTGCGWVTVGFGSLDVSAGGGSGKRANARTGCANSNPVAYREQVDVDLLNWNDPSGYTEGPEIQVACYPF